MKRLPLLLTVGLALTVGASACEDRPSWARERLSSGYFDSTGTYKNAGVSTRIQADITPLDPESLHGDTLVRAFQLFRMRCAACHRVPDPTMKEGQYWPYTVGKMRERTEKAGLVPMTEAEADSILDFLRRHSKP